MMSEENVTQETTETANQPQEVGTLTEEEMATISQLRQNANQLLNQLAENSNGKFYRLKNINSLVKDINKRDDIVNIHYEESTFRDIVDYSWLFVLLILSFGLEWFIRRRSGTY